MCGMPWPVDASGFVIPSEIPLDILDLWSCCVLLVFMMQFLLHRTAWIDLRINYTQINSVYKEGDLYNNLMDWIIFRGMRL